MHARQTYTILNDANCARARIMYSRHQLQLLLVALTAMASNGSLNSSYFGQPMIFPYGNCSAVPSPQSLTIYYSNMLNYSTSLGGFMIGGSAPILAIGPISVDRLAILNLITPTELASEFHHCLHYYCDQTQAIGSVRESVRGICTVSDSVTAFASVIAEDPTVMSLVSHKIRERVYVYSSIPVEEEVYNSSAQNTFTYKYMVLHGKPRNSSIPAVAITFPTVDTECANISITTTVDALIYRARHRDEFVQSTYANTTLVVKCLTSFEVVWIQPRISSCKQETPSLQGTVIRSTTSMAVYVAEADCNVTRGDRGFGYVGHPIYSLPPSRKWGTTFVTDLGRLQQHPIRRELHVAALFHTVADEDTEITVTAYSPGNKLPVHSKKYELKAEQPLTINVGETTYTYLIIRSSIPVLIVYELCEKKSDKPYFSSLLQPVEWFSRQQSLLLSRSLVPQVEQYYITLVITTPKSYNIKDIHIQREGYEQSVPLLEYFHSGDITSYSIEQVLVVSVAVDSKTLGSNDTYLIAKSLDACMEIGASVVYYGEHSGYGHTNTHVLDKSQLGDPKLCMQHTSKKRSVVYIIASVILGSLLLLVSIITIIILYIYLQHIQHPPGAPHNNFEYDVFLSFADADRSFVTDHLHIPLKAKEYSVFWHYCDFIAGLTIDENIIRATKLSRTVIFVCSKHFHASEFCQKELKYALHSHYKEYNGKYRRVIPLVIQDGECTKELQQLHPIRAMNTTSASITNCQKLIKRLHLGKPMKDCKERNKRDISHNHVEPQRFSPSDNTDTEVINTV